MDEGQGPMNQGMGVAILWYSRLRRLRSGDAEPIRHSHQLGQRFRLHLAHDIAAMNLHGNLANVEIGGDLLVQTAGHHQRHHFSFARAQGA